MTLIANPPHNREAVEEQAIQAAADKLDPIAGVSIATGILLKADSIASDGCHIFNVEHDGESIITDGVLIENDGDCSRFAASVADAASLSIDDIATALAVYRAAWAKTGKRKPETYFSPITAAELDAGDFSINYLVHGIICEKQPVILAGQFKTLKTSIALDLAVSIASGTNFLNQFAVEQRSTMVLTAESGFATVQETCRRISRSRGFNLGDVPDLRFCDRVPRLENASHISELAEIMKDAGVKVLVADPAYLMIEGSEAGNLFSMGEQLRIFADLASEAEATPILLHHAKKNNGNAVEYQPLELGDIAWAGFAEFARQWILLSRRERYEEGTGNHRLWMSVGGSAGHNGCWGLDIAEGHPDDIGGRRWDLTLADAKEAKESAVERNEQAKEKNKRRIIEKNAGRLRDAFIGVGRHGITQSEAYAKAGLNASAGRAAIGWLLTHEIVESCEVTKGNGRTYDGYRLTSDAEDEAKSIDTDGGLFDVA